MGLIRKRKNAVKRSSSRMISRWFVLFWALSFWIKRALTGARLTERPISPQRILLAQHLLLGDTLMLVPLLARLRERYPCAEIVMLCPPPFIPLMVGNPYQVRVLAYDPRSLLTLQDLLHERGFDWAILPVDARYSWLALALHARWISTFAGDTPAYKNWPVNELVPVSTEPIAMGDMFAQLCDQIPPCPHRAATWLVPKPRLPALPTRPYVVCHLGASTYLKHWAPESWQRLALDLQAQGYDVIWSTGPGEGYLVQQVDPTQRFIAFAGTLTLAQLWHVIASASLLVSPDTGVAHIAKITATPVVVLFGPGSALLCGAGAFWQQVPYYSVTAPIACRNQTINFKRTLSWVARCERLPPACVRARCMEKIAYQSVWQMTQSALA